MLKLRKMKIANIILLLLIPVGALWAQQEGTVTIQGKAYPYIIDGCGDTVIVAQLDDVSVTSKKAFKDDEEYKKYRRYRAYATKVYPYAVEAVKVFRQIEIATEDMRRGKAKRYAKHLQKELDEKFEDPLKKLSRTQGLILIKMIERELDIPTYDLIKDLRGGFSATYWNTLGKFYGYHIKEGYKPGQDPILDMVLADFDISY